MNPHPPPALPLRFFVSIAAMTTISATFEALRAFRGSEDVLRGGALYAITVVVPWIFFLVEWRKGAAFRAAIASAIFGPAALHIASGIIAHPERRWSTRGIFWALAVGISVTVVVLLLQKFRLVPRT
jgi:hypothetical protein